MGCDGGRTPLTAAFVSARSVDEALSALESGARPVAGGTDLVVGARQGKSALPERIVTVAGLCVGWPAEAGRITPRLGLDATVHEDRFGAGDLDQQLDAYDRRRDAQLPYRRQRAPERWGQAPLYGWSEDKARQYAEPLRTDFGSFVRAKGFRLD